MNNEGLEKSKNALELMNDFNLTMFSNEEKSINCIIFPII